jgi:Ser/Thr protein kinase RdoA (MazF antagonist)
MIHYFPVTHSILSVEALTIEVLLNYSLNSIISFRFLQQGLNDTYEFTTAYGEKYILRIYRAGWRSLSDISYEIDVLNHLSSRGIPVSKPLPQKDGTFIRTLLAPEGTRHAVLFTYAAGNGISYKKDAERVGFNYGQAVAKIHNAVQDFTSQHARFPLDLDYLIDTPLKSIGPLLSHRQEDWVYLQEVADKIRNRLIELPSDALEQGVCHGDFNGGNAHIADDGTITFFDFDCCGWGWRAYDLAVFRWLARINGQEKERWEPFLRGYREEKNLNEIDLQAVPLFIGIRNMWIFGLHAGNGHDWGFGWLNDKHFDLVIKFFHDWDAEYFAETS